MITSQVIDTLYKKYKKRPASPDDLDVSVLFDGDVADIHNLTITPDDKLEIGTLDRFSPFHFIPMRNIHAFVEFEKWVAIVLHSSIVFLNKKEPQINVNIKPIRPTLLDRLKDKINS